ncbi:MAG: hypothetical protein EPO11_08335 [Gammaproteobacteria bacterium]|nr:MAG: hypothetical protein EPO11_08335 [Gammaproteobacteria bacterium]
MTQSHSTLSASEHAYPCGVKCIAWSAIVVGAFAMIGLSFLLDLLSLSIGFSAFSAMEDNEVTFAMGGFIGLVIITLISTFVGGWLSGYLGRPYCTKRNLGAVYGFTTWCLALLISILIASGVGQFIANYSYLISRNMPAIALSASTVSPKTAAGSLSIATFVAFFLFAIGALSATLGGRNGIKMKEE